MAKVTSKLQVTIPKVLAERFGIHAGDEIEWNPAGEFIRLIPRGAPRQVAYSVADRLRFFDQATQRQQERERQRLGIPTEEERGWTRDALYDRARPR